MENPEVFGEAARLRRLLQTVIAGDLVDPVATAIRACSPAHPLMDQVLVVGSPLLDLIVQLAASPILVSLLSVTHLLAVTPDGQRFLLMLGPAALASIPLITLIHIRHRKLAQVRTGAWFRRTRCNRKQTRAFKYPRDIAFPLEKYATLVQQSETSESGLQRNA
jgi:hypothetical protein